MEPAQTPSDKPESWFDSHFHILVMGLLLCIVVSLAVLWFGERRKRIAAESELNSVRMELFATQAILQSNPPTWPLPSAYNADESADATATDPGSDPD